MYTALFVGAALVGVGAAYAAAAGWALVHGVSVWIVLAGAVAAYFLIPVLATTSWFLLAWIFRAPRPPGLHLSAAGRVRLFWNEMRAIGRNAPRMVLYRLLVRDPPPAAAAAPVLLLHGVLCNAGVWGGLRRYLRAQRIGPVYTLSYGPPLASIELFADHMAARIDAIVAATGAARVAVVGHSMGGLVARAYLRRYGAAKLSTLITVGTPHHGSVHAWLFPGVCLAQMRPGNSWLAALNADEGASLPLPTVSLWSWHDSMVAPQTSARLAGAENVELAGVGHNALLYDPPTYARIAALLRDASAESVAPAADALAHPTVATAD
jgi:pimeloyl-ACP methyl ester carboxylesterase